MLQDRIFSDIEGDRWFERNRKALNAFDASADLPLKLIGLYGVNPERVLEIGASNGFRLAAIHERTGAAAVALEPSAQAVLNGKASFPFITFIRGTASAVPLRECFDLVIVNFVFHWIDRQSLLRAVAEVDRLVSDGGYLLVGDFQPANQLQVPYHHLETEAVYTYKQNYAATFLASGLYHPVSLLTAHHASKGLQARVTESERVGAWLLRKELQGHYLPSAVNNGRE
ncbi:MAG: class I SAM-dependent methyltransferase [Candidatus Binatia bacterium]